MATVGPSSDAGSHNPFSSRDVRPGAIPFCFASETEPEALLDKLAAGGWWGEIVGPHGSGKSTLIQTLIPGLQERGRKVVFFLLQRGQRSLSLGRGPNTAEGKRSDWDEQTQVIVDGYEQLSLWSAWRLRRTCQRFGAGLLVTSHRSVGLPPLRNTATSVNLANQLVDLLARSGPTHVTPADVTASFTRQKGNLREVFFELYDLYEQRRSQLTQPALPQLEPAEAERWPDSDHNQGAESGMQRDFPRG